MIDAKCFIEKDCNITFSLNDSSYDGIARCVKRSKDDVGGKKYFIQISHIFMKNVTEVVSVEVARYIREALLLHEISHINEGSFDVIELLDKEKETLKEIYNIIEDMRVEYKMQLEYPKIADYFELTLNVMSELQKREQDNIDLQKRYIYTLFDYIRYEKIDFEMIEFINFLIPLRIRLQNCKSSEAFVIAQLIKGFIEYKLMDDKFDDNTKSITTNGLTKDCESDKRKIFDDSTIEGIKEKFQKMKENENETTQSDSQLEQQIISNSKVILDMRNSFKLLFESLKSNEVYEGELNLLRQQQAYINSITGDEEKNYIELKRNFNIEFDFILIRDTSGSIMPHKKDYFNATLSILASLENFENVNTFCIRFSHGANIEKKFGDKLLDANLVDVADGGTNLLNALQIAKKIEYKSNNKFYLILTDGETNNHTRCSSEISELRKDKGNIILVIRIGDLKHIPTGSLIDKCCAFENLTETLYGVIYRYIIENGVDARYD